jgi:hypothetical protein
VPSSASVSRMPASGHACAPSKPGRSDLRAVLRDPIRGRGGRHRGAGQTRFPPRTGKAGSATRPRSPWSGLGRPRGPRPEDVAGNALDANRAARAHRGTSRRGRSKAADQADRAVGGGLARANNPRTPGSPRATVLDLLVRAGPAAWEAEVRLNEVLAARSPGTDDPDRDPAQDKRGANRRPHHGNVKAALQERLRRK